MKLKAKRPITHQGKTHKAGDVFEANEPFAQDLIKQGHAEPHKEEGEPPKQEGEDEKPEGGVPPSGSSTPKR